MSKSSFFTGQPIFNQILSLIPRSLVRRLNRQHQGDRYCKKFRSYDHLVAMLYCVFNHCSSLREVITGMQASSSRLAHLGLTYTPRRSTLADANQRRPAEFFQDLYHALYHEFYGVLPDSLTEKELIELLFIIDSTIISLFSGAMRSTGSYGLTGKKKGGLKAHVVMRAQDNVPGFVWLTEGRVNDKKFMPLVQLPAGSIVVMDKGYVSYKQFNEWTKQNITWVSRVNASAKYTAVRQRDLSDTQVQQGVEEDLEIDLGNPKTKRLNPIQPARLITFCDPVTKKRFQFITNNLTYCPAIIAMIYKLRWRIETLFKGIKGNAQLQYFLGDNENAIRIQVWCTLIADLLLKVIKRKADKKKRWSMANLSGLVRLHLGTYINLYAFLAAPEKALLNYEDPIDKRQLSMFSNQPRGA
jgi:Domain of unknown function (DUF4372)/Transposase DDE domain